MAALKAYLLAFCRGCDLVVASSNGMCALPVDFGTAVPVEVVRCGADRKCVQRPIEPISWLEMGCALRQVIARSCRKKSLNCHFIHLWDRFTR